MSQEVLNKGAYFGVNYLKITVIVTMNLHIGSFLLSEQMSDAPTDNDVVG